jgi:tetratricopeptide (TPR) repeat protein
MPERWKISFRLVCVMSTLLAFGVGDVARLEAQASASGAQPPPSPESYLGNSYYYYQLGRFSDSVNAAREALKLRRDYAPAWNNIAASFIGLNLWEDAIAAAEESIRLQPDNELARNNLAWAQLNLETTPESFLTRSFQYFQRGRFNETIMAARAALKMRPDYAEAWNNIAAAYNSMSRWANAIQACEQAIRLKPDFPVAKNNLTLAKAKLAKQMSGGGR